MARIYALLILVFIAQATFASYIGNETATNSTRIFHDGTASSNVTHSTDSLSVAVQHSGGSAASITSSKSFTPEIVPSISASSSKHGGLGSLIAKGLSLQTTTLQSSSATTSDAPTAPASGTSLVSSNGHVPTAQLLMLNHSAPLNTDPTRSRVIAGTGTGLSSATITNAPIWNNVSLSGPSGFVILNNHTIKTMCDLEGGCYSTCTKYSSSLSEDFVAWSSSSSSFEASMQSANPKSSSTIVSPLFRRPAQEYTYFETTATLTELVTEGTYTTFTSVETDTYILSSSKDGILKGWTSLYTTVVPASWPYTEPKPARTTFNCFQNNCSACTIYGGTVQLFYWPTARPTLLSNATQAALGNTTQATQLSTANVTEAVVNGITITSPSVAISFHTIYAENDCSTIVGGEHKGSLMVLNTKDVSSLDVGNGAFGGATIDGTYIPPFYDQLSINYADLNFPYPLSAWIAQPQCFDGGDYEGCLPMTSGSLKPILAVPSQIRTIDPAWESCGLWFSGLYDPPSALQPVSVAALPSIPAQHTSTPAKASATPTPPAPQTSTHKAVPTTSSHQTSTKTGLDPADPVDPTTASAQPDQGQSTSSTQNAGGAIASIIVGGQSTHSVQSEASVQPSASDPGTNSASGNAGGVIASVVVGGQSTNNAQSGAPVQSSANDPGTNSASSDAGGAIASVIGGQTTQVSLSSVGQSGGGQSAVSQAAGGQSATPDISGGQPSVNAPGAAQTTRALSSAQQAATIGSGSSAVTLTPGLGGEVVVGSSGSPVTTLRPGDTATIDNTPVAVDDTEGVVVLTSSTFLLDPSESQSSLEVNGQSASLISNGVVIGGSQTLTAGGPATTLGGQVFSALPQGGLLSVGSKTLAFAVPDPPSETENPEAVFTASGQLFTAFQPIGSSQDITIIGDGSTIVLGADTSTTLDGQVLSVAGDAQLVFGTRTLDYVTPTAVASGAMLLATVATFEADGHNYTAFEPSGSSSAVIDGTLLSVGGPAITMSGETLSLGTNGLIIASDGVTSTIPFQSTSLAVAPKTEVEAIVTLGSESITAYEIAGSGGTVEIGGTMLSVGGPALTSDGETISLASNGLVVHSSGEAGSGTIVFSTAVVTPTGSGDFGILAGGLGPWASDPTSLRTGGPDPTASTTSSGGSNKNGAKSSRPVAGAELLLGVLVTLTSMWLL